MIHEISKMYQKKSTGLIALMRASPLLPVYKANASTGSRNVPRDI